MKPAPSIHLPELKPSIHATFIERPNRFLAKVQINTNKPTETLAHIHDPGRLIELLTPGAKLILQEATNPKRKTKYDVLFVKYKNYWVLINSKYHNQIVSTLLSSSFFNLPPLKKIKQEYSIGKSRLDFYAETNTGIPVFIEVKGCTLEKNNIALFPDAPTKRGEKHVNELAFIKKKHKAAHVYIIILVFHENIKCFKPNEMIDPKFTQSFYSALHQGVDLIALEVKYDPLKNTFTINKRIPLCNASSGV